MSEIKRCKECGTPLMVSKENTWYANGVVAQARDFDHRMLFYESDNISALFTGIEHILGLPIDKIVVESKRREVKEYVEKMMSAITRKAVKHVGIGMMIGTLSRNGQAFGYGDIDLVERRRKNDSDDFITMSVRNPHSIFFFCGEVLGAWEAIDGRDHFASYEEVEPGFYRVTCRVGEHPLELQERLNFKTYPYKPGDIEYERCGTCEVPLSVAKYTWDLEAGTIVHPDTRRRMSIFGPRGMEAILDDLEAELGETIPETVIEAQRLTVRMAMKDMKWVGDDQRYRKMMAFRGLGNIVMMKRGDKSLSVRMENSCIDLMAVGMFQALFELMSGTDTSKYEYAISPDGVIDITVSLKN
ncbi:MAG TPA: hypothetical protein VIK22_02975 [Candidatus Anoxymicrobiaceae bacterium]